MARDAAPRLNDSGSRPSREGRGGRATALALSALLLLATSAPAKPRAVAYLGRAMGTYSRVVLVTADSAATAPLARQAQATFARIDSLMTNWTTTSEVARLNREAANGLRPRGRLPAHPSWQLNTTPAVKKII